MSPRRYTRRTTVARIEHTESVKEKLQIRVDKLLAKINKTNQLLEHLRGKRQGEIEISKMIHSPIN